MVEEQKTVWWEDKYNLIFLGILILAFAIRFYLFILTRNQALWWDSAEYLTRAKGFAFGTPITAWNPSREIIFPFLISLFLRIGFGEITIRFLQVLVSTFTIFMLYITVKSLFNKKLALIASFLMSFCWLHIFFTERILMYIWPCWIYLVIIFFFWKGYVKKEKKAYLYLFAISASIGFQMYFSTALLILGILFFVFVTERLSFLKRKDFWIALLVFFLVLSPYMIYSQITYGFPIPRIAQGLGVVTAEQAAKPALFFGYAQILPSRMGWIAIIFVGLGILLFLFQFFIRANKIFKEYRNFDNWILVFWSFLIPFVFYSYIAAISWTVYDAFVLGSFPFLFILASNPILKIYEFIKQHTKIVAIVFILAILGFHAYSNSIDAYNFVMAKEPSFRQLKEVSLWVKMNTPKDSVIYTTSPPQVNCYGERATARIPDTEAEMEAINLSKNSYYLISIFERTSQQWLFEYPSKKNMTALMVSFMDEAKQYPGAIVYKID